MKRANRLNLVLSCILAGQLACVHSQTEYSEILLDGFSDSNYAKLNSNLGSPVCVRGRIQIDSMGIYFPLRPAEEGDVIDIGFSRILSGYSLVDDPPQMRDGGVYTVCGILRDATPFRRCDHNYCRWYNLSEPELR